LESFVIKLSSYEPHEFSKLFRCFYGQNLVRILYTYTTIRSVRFARKKVGFSSSSWGGSRPYRAVAREARVAYEARGSKATLLSLSFSLPPPLLYHFVYQWEGKRAGQYSVVTYCSFGKAPVPEQKRRKSLSIMSSSVTLLH